MSQATNNKRVIRRHPQSRKLRAVKIGEGVPSIPDLHAELIEMTDVLLGRKEPPEGAPANIMALMEIADAYFARASELTMLLMEMERDGRVARGSGHYRFRTGELRTFTEMAKRAAELGSRRITYMQMQMEAERTGRGF
jgi:hypothetical protein